MKKIFTTILILFVLIATAQNKENPYPMGWDVLSQHEISEWFKDARFGIYAHLGVYCVPAFEGEWYPRLMLQEGHKVQKHHIETYGPVNEFIKLS